VIHTEAGAPPPATPAARLAAIRRLLLDDTLALEDRIAGCLVVLYGQQASRIAALRITEVSCTDAAARLKLGADWLDVPGPVATLLRHHLRNHSNMTTAANPASPWLFPGQLAGEHHSYRRLIVSLNRLGIPARASRSRRRSRRSCGSALSTRGSWGRSSAPPACTWEPARRRRRAAWHDQGERPGQGLAAHIPGEPLAASRQAGARPAAGHSWPMRPWSCIGDPCGVSSPRAKSLNTGQRMVLQPPTPGR